MVSPSYRAVIRVLVEARQNAGLSQRALADALGKPPSWVAKVELGERRLDILEFVAIARALRLKEADLLKAVTHALPKQIDI